MVYRLTRVDDAVSDNIVGEVDGEGVDGVPASRACRRCMYVCTVVVYVCSLAAVCATSGAAASSRVAAS
jgi:hypothetical protein